MDTTNKITLYRGWLDTGKYVWSPFVIKLEARLRLAGIQYTTESGSPRTAPKGKIPYIECRTGNSIDILSDSSVIIAQLVDHGIVPDLNVHLSAETRAYDLSLRALLEERLYFFHSFERWIQNYYVMRDYVLWAVPWLARVIVGFLAYRHTVSTLHGQGTGRHSPDEIASFRHEIWETIAGMLAAAKAKKTIADDHPFWALGEDEPTEADCVLFGFIVSVLVAEAAPDSRKVVRSYPVLLDYAGRIHDKYFPDYEKWNTRITGS